MKVTLKVWRQANTGSKGKFETHEVDDINPNMSFLEMMDTLNEKIISSGEIEPIAFDSDCREGICGMCSMVVNGRPHGPNYEATTCQLYMRDFKDGETIFVEPFRASAFPILKDLVVDRTAFDEIIYSGGFISTVIGGSPDANAIPIPKPKAEVSMDAAACIGCGACVAACKNSSAMLFVSAKVTHLGVLPQGEQEKKERVVNMINKMDELGFGNCTNEGECEAECPKGIKVVNIARLNRDYLYSGFSRREV